MTKNRDRVYFIAYVEVYRGTQVTMQPVRSRGGAVKTYPTLTDAKERAGMMGVGIAITELELERLNK